MVAPYDHVRVPADAETLPAGVYRVVGSDADRVTLLAVGDETGARVHTGRVERVPLPTFDQFESAESPDPSGGLTRLRDVLGGLALTARLAPRRMAGRPLQTLVGVVLVVVESLGPATVGVSESVLTVAGVFGILALTGAALDMP
ncbi:hypothetical protein [Halomarina rubra]|uniref:Uncharacterized protein n=1 Tax=Halomarina rubra TaxID=2071873 RepID=A0ABD6AWE4_9EURY|nr:hypothetical protein [Halomarina rubra]